MKNMKKIVMPLVAGVLLTVGAQAQTKIAIEGQAYVITGTASSVNGTFNYEWYRNNVLISECTAATCTVPANLCNGYNVEFKRKIVVTSGCAGDTEGFTNTVTVTFKCGGGHGTKIGPLCWADRNVGAAGAFTATAHEYSQFYQWNRNKAWAATGSIVGWNSTGESSGWTVNPNPCPTGWRLPLDGEWTSLLYSYSSTWATAGSKGNTVTGKFFGQPNSASCSFPNNMANCIFLPATGYRANSNGALTSQGTYGYYWSSQDYGSNGYYGYVYTTADDASYEINKANGLAIRCVQ